MSIKIIHRILCDLCGKTLEDESYVYLISPDWKPPIPTMQYNFRLGGTNVDLCSECALPIFDAKDKRIQELKESGKLTGYPNP